MILNNTLFAFCFCLFIILRCVEAEVLDCGLKVSEFEFQSGYYVYF